MNTKSNHPEHKIEQLISKADNASMRLCNDPASVERINEYRQAKTELQNTIIEMREALEAIILKPDVSTGDFKNAASG